MRYIFTNDMLCNFLGVLLLELVSKKGINIYNFGVEAACHCLSLIFCRTEAVVLEYKNDRQLIISSNKEHTLHDMLDFVAGKLPGEKLMLFGSMLSVHKQFAISKHIEWI